MLHSATIWKYVLFQAFSAREVSVVLELDRGKLAPLIARAKGEDQQFIFFNSQRRKTGANRLGVLNPLAIEWVDKWLTESEKTKPRKRKENRVTKDRVVSEVFDVTAEGVNKMLRSLAKKVNIVKTGPRVHFHKLRGWVMSGLSRAGLNEFQIIYLMGKSIPLTDMTYLQTLQQEIEEKYPEACERYFNLKPQVPAKIVIDLRKQLEQQAQEIAELRQSKSELDDIRTVYAKLKPLIEHIDDFSDHLERKEARERVEQQQQEDQEKTEIREQGEK